MAFGDEEKMNGGLGSNVFEDDNPVVFMYDISGELPGRNTAKNTLGHVSDAPLRTSFVLIIPQHLYSMLEG